jgi:hypothetical protein
MLALTGIATNATETWKTVGAIYWVPADHAGVTTALFRALLATDDAGVEAQVRVWNNTDDEAATTEEVTSSETLDAVSAVVMFGASSPAVFAVQVRTATAGYTATVSNAWVQLGSNATTCTLSAVPASVYAGVAASFGVTVSSGVPWVLDVDGVLYSGTGTGAEQTVAVTVPTGGGARTIDVRLSVGVTEDTDTVAVQEIERLGELCVAMTPGSTATQAYTGHEGDLYVWVGTYKSNATTERVTGITYGGVAMTKVAAAASSSDPHVWMHCYRLAAASMPAAGAANIVVSFASSSINGIALGVIEIGGAVGAPDDSQFGSSACPNDTVVSVTTAVANSVVMGAVICSDDATYTPLSGQTKIGECDPGSYAGMAIGWYQAGAAGSVAASWTPSGYTGSGVIAHAIAVRPA